MTYNKIAENFQTTVVTEYIKTSQNSTLYQTEKQLEDEFINLLIQNGYSYLKIKNQQALEDNLQQQLEKLNNIKFTKNEWQHLFTNYLAPKNQGISEKTKKIQEDPIYPLNLDNHQTKNIYIIDKKNPQNNTLQVINQYEADGNYKNRYDVTILINGLPLVHIELKARGVAIKEAFNQIHRYQKDSFFSGSGLFEYVNLFVISNGTSTKYYSNTTRQAQISSNQDTKIKKNITAPKSFEFTSWWADANNKKISDLIDFTKTFFTKHTLLSLLTKYCILDTANNLKVMRPYQIVATERIINKIICSKNHNKLGTQESGGYIWHTTGSGKTLTSFKAAQLATNIEGVKKVIFVVDRKDLDHQTCKEYQKFDKDSTNSTLNTKELTKFLNDQTNNKIIVTTIQKLSIFIEKNKTHNIYNDHIVLIFDECHRSQFGKMRQQITKTFKKYNMFGFTGTPIFEVNSAANSHPYFQTTEQIFGKNLHTYTIVNAIEDGNVLHFKIDYISTAKSKDNIIDKKIKDIDKTKFYNNDERINLITEYIINNFNNKTNNSQYTKSRFNSIFAVSSIEAAKKYYTAFKKQNSPLKVATIYSYSPNEDPIITNNQGTLNDETLSANELDASSRDFLEQAIQDYNKMFNANYNTQDQFEGYYRDISKRMKNQEIDILIVVNMFLTGFDSQSLNTLWVDKDLKYHGLIQAFSRTNRILNSTKSYGYIVCFRYLEEETNEALKLFGDEKQIGKIILLKSYQDYYNGYQEDNKIHKGYKELIQELQENFTENNTPVGEQSEKHFIELWGNILKLQNILKSSDEFTGNEILTPRDFQNYSSIYLDLNDKYRQHINQNKEDIQDDIVFELELIKQVTVNIDYLLNLIFKYQQSNMQNDKIKEEIDKSISSSYNLRSKKDLIFNFIDHQKTIPIQDERAFNHQWQEFTEQSKQKELAEIIQQENLNKDKTIEFINTSFELGEIKEEGTDLTEILPKKLGSMFSKNNDYSKNKNRIIEKLKTFLSKYLNL